MKTYLIVLAVLGALALVFLKKIKDLFSSFYSSPSNGGGTYNNDNPVSLTDTIGNFFVPATAFPGGETQGTSETYTGATLETLSHPIDSLKSIFGM